MSTPAATIDGGHPEVWGIPAEDAIQYVGNLLPYLKHFEERSNGRCRVSDLWKAIEHRDRQVWVCGAFQAVCLTRMGETFVEITHLSGVRRLEWQGELEAKLIEWARAHGKKRIHAFVRPGWSREMSRRNWREAHREMVREL